MSQRLSGVLIDAGVDYLTVTAKSVKAQESIAEICRAIAESQFYDGFVARPSSFSGYSGMQVGHVYFGERDDSCIARLGAYVAKAHFKRLIEAAENITRIDLQCTFQLESDVAPVLGQHYKQMLKYAHGFKRKPMPSLFIGRDLSRTVYSGSRSSDRYGRIYDKGIESGLAQFEGCIRYEVEFKSKRALLVAACVCAGPNNFSGLAAGVLRFFQDRGCSLGDLPAMALNPAIDIAARVPAHHTDIEDMLKWLGVQVRPTVQRLLNRGLQESLVAVLGLPVATELAQVGQHET